MTHIVTHNHRRISAFLCKSEAEKLALSRANAFVSSGYSKVKFVSCGGSGYLLEREGVEPIDIRVVELGGA
jgi:hypothetical protein